MTFVATYLLCLLVPGWLLARTLRLPAHGLPQIVALSGLLVWLLLVAGKLAGVSTVTFAILFSTTLLAVTLACGMTVYLRYRQSLRVAGGLLAVAWRSPARAASVHGITLIYATAAVIYAVLAGAYLEIPADTWWHLGQIKNQAWLLAEDRAFTAPLYGAGFDKANAYWHLFVAVIAYISGSAVSDIAIPLAMANTVVLLIAVYCFSNVVFASSLRSAAGTAVISVLAGAWFMLHYGVNVFSFTRYYVYAPALVNFIILAATVSLVLRALRRQQLDTATTLLVPAYILLMAAMHLQEALFAVVLITLMLAHYLACSGEPGVSAWSGLFRTAGAFPHRFRTGALLATWTLVLAYLVLHGYAFLELERSPALEFNRLLPAGNLLPFLRNLYVLDPTYQFYQVVTVWGLLVYILYFLYRREFAGNHYIFAGMVVPLVTVFNPLFVDLALRFTTAEFIWRFCYMIPLPLVAALVTVRLVGSLVRGRAVAPRVAALAGLALLVLLLFPLHGRYLEAPYSRLYSLTPVAPGNGPALWRDLYAALDDIPKGILLTDPVTGYTANAMTRSHWSPGYKFLDPSYVSLTKDAYDPDDFRKVAGWLLVINLRDGADSRTGTISGHWPGDILKVSERYSPALIEFVRSNPAIFTPLWYADRIHVYRINAR